MCLFEAVKTCVSSPEKLKVNSFGDINVIESLIVRISFYMVINKITYNSKIRGSFFVILLKCVTVESFLFKNIFLKLMVSASKVMSNIKSKYFFKLFFFKNVFSYFQGLGQ